MVDQNSFIYHISIKKFNLILIFLQPFHVTIFFNYRTETTKDEPWAWEAREYLRKKLIGEEVFFTSEKPPNTNREYGTVFLGKGKFCSCVLLVIMSF